MKKYVGNCSDAFDWDQIISKFDEQQVSHKKYEEGSTASKEIDDAWAESKESVDFFTSVSYTHLTLPTKRIV